MLPRDVGSIPSSAFSAGAVEFWNFVRFDFGAPLLLTDCPGGFVGDVDGGGSKTWVGGKIPENGVGPSSQGAKNPMQIDQILVDNSDRWWNTFIRAQANGVDDFDVTTYIGWFDASGSFIEAFLDYKGYTDSIQEFSIATIALKSQTTAHGLMFPCEEYTTAQVPTLPPVDDVLQVGSTTSKQLSAAVPFTGASPAPPPPDNTWDPPPTGGGVIVVPIQRGPANRGGDPPRSTQPVSGTRSS